MPTASKATASQVEELDGYEGRFEDLGGYTVAFETYTADADLGPLFAGLPDDRCQCEHWGYVVKGKLIYRYADGTEDIVTGGQAYYARPGHTPVLFAGTEVVEFSPTAALHETLAVVTKNLEQMAGE